LPQQVSKYSEAELAIAKGKMVDNAIVTLQNLHPNSISTSQVIGILDGQRTVEGHINKAKLNIIFDNCFELEKQTIDEMLKNHEISALNADLYMRIARRTIIQYQQSNRQKLSLFLKFNFFGRFSFSKKARLRRKMYHNLKPHKDVTREQMIERNHKLWRQMGTFEEEPYKKIISYLNQSLVNDSENSREISIARRAYDERHRRISNSEMIEENQNELLIEAFQQENNYIQTKITDKEFSSDLGSALYEQISTDQLVYLQSINEE